MWSALWLEPVNSLRPPGRDCCISDSRSKIGFTADEVFRNRVERGGRDARRAVNSPRFSPPDETYRQELYLTSASSGSLAPASEPCHLRLKERLSAHLRFTAQQRPLGQFPDAPASACPLLGSRNTSLSFLDWALIIPSIESRSRARHGMTRALR